MEQSGCSSLTFVLSALASAGISAWLLFVMLPADLFWLVIFMDLVSALAGLLMPWRCPRRHARLLLPLARMSSGSGLSLFVCGAIVASERAVIRDVTKDAMLTGFQVTMVAVAGIATSTSSLYFVLITTLPTEVRELHRLGRRKRLLSRWSPKAQELLCDDMGALVSGECAICLEELADIEVDRQGVLRLPCQHTFHCQCVGRWFGREPTCPICRHRIRNFGSCVHICPRAAAEENAASRTQAQPAPQGGSRSKVTRVPAETQTDPTLADVIGVVGAPGCPLADPEADGVPRERGGTAEGLDPSDVHAVVFVAAASAQAIDAPFARPWNDEAVASPRTPAQQVAAQSAEVCGHAGDAAPPPSCDIFPWWRGASACAGRPGARVPLSL